MQSIIILYDKEDVIEFNNHNEEIKDIFLFSPGLELFLKNKDNYNIFKPNKNSEISIQKKIIYNSKKFDQEFKKNYYLLKDLDKGIIENIHNITFITLFSFLYLIGNLKEFEKFTLIYNKKVYKFENFDEFIPLFLKKIFHKKNQGFFNYLKLKKKSSFYEIVIKLSNLICRLGKKTNSTIIVGSLLTKKILDESDKENIVFQLTSYYDFKVYHLIFNIFSLLNFFKKKKKFYYFPILNDQKSFHNFKKNLFNFFNSFKDKNFKYFKNILLDELNNYCQNQMNLKDDICKLLDFVKPKCVFVDQLRFGLSTILASSTLSRKIDVILVPHGSISIPNEEYSEFVLSICARGLIYSKIASYSVAQSKISFEAIKYYDKNLKILKSKPLLFGKNSYKKNKEKNERFVFLHASTPKSLSKWPWIYESYNEYVNNIKDLIDKFKNLSNIELRIRFREGPECDLETFKKLVDINKNDFVRISKNKDFFKDLEESDCLISFSSTSIEEALFLNKKILIYQGSKNYRHINYKFNGNNDIIYTDQKNISKSIDLIMNNQELPEYDVLWNNDIHKDESLNKYIYKNEI